MTENLLHFIWKYGLFDKQDLKSADGEKIELVNRGTHNTNAGADFTNAKIRIGKTLWAGNVEMHIKSSDWFAHKHDNDAAYNNVVLHVVYELNGKTATRQTGEQIPTLELKQLIKPETLSRYTELNKRQTWIPCANFFSDVKEITLNNLLERLLIERLEQKVTSINELLKTLNNDWEMVMFVTIARYFGAGVNKEQFQQLGVSLPVMVWAKHQHDALQLEALVFGQAGLLDEKFTDDYPNKLRKEYNYLKRLHSLEPMPRHVWKFLRLRPSNFPTLRMAQLAALMGKEVKLFSNLLEAKNVKAIHRFFDVDVSDYWTTHYQFDKESKKVNSHIGGDMKNILLINAVAPVLFAYGKYKDEESYCDRALKLLESCAAEGNAIIEGWLKLGVNGDSAWKSQALLQLKNEYCNKFRCLECAIGHSILK